MDVKNNTNKQMVNFFNLIMKKFIITIYFNNYLFHS